MAFRGLLACLVASLGLSWPNAQDVQAVDTIDHDPTTVTASPLSLASTANGEGVEASDPQQSSELSGWDFPLTATSVSEAETTTPAGSEPQITALLPEAASNATVSQISLADTAEAIHPKADDRPFEATVSAMVAAFGDDASAGQKLMALESGEPTPAVAVEHQPEPAQTLASDTPAEIGFFERIAQSAETVTEPIATQVAEQPQHSSSSVPIAFTANDPFQPYPVQNQDQEQGESLACHSSNPNDSGPSMTLVTTTPVPFLIPGTHPNAKAEVVEQTTLPVPALEVVRNSEPDAAELPTAAVEKLVAPESLIVAEHGWTAPPAVDLTAEELLTAQAAPELAPSSYPDSTSGQDWRDLPRKDRVASAVQLTRQAIRAWAAAFSDRQQIASQPSALTR